MNRDLWYLHNGKYYQFGVLNDGRCYDVIELPGVFIIYVFKRHNHNYMFKGFIYESKYIYCSDIITTKEKLYCAIQNFLE